MDIGQARDDNRKTILAIFFGSENRGGEHSKIVFFIRYH